MGKKILITGSTDGIGKLAAMRLAKVGHDVYIHGRNADKVADVISEIKEVSNNDNVDGFVADLSDLDAVRMMNAAVLESLPHLDVLINNAGVFKSAATLANGRDIRFEVNYLAPYLQTYALLPLLKKGSASRIINLSSAAQAPVDHNALRGNQPIGVQSAYAQSKLALTMWSFHLAKVEPDLSVIAVNPGSLLNTNMVREAYGKFWSPASKGGDILYDLAISNEYEGVTGKYFDNDQGNPKGAFGQAHEDAYDDEKISTLIKLTNEILNFKSV